ncbi:MAG: hypothetical protein K0S41_2909 [Anaerocolumna sp.]|jgi:hypothetical protein|nr:hypothetical protein [Anaerocolumna sp.]
MLPKHSQMQMLLVIYQLSKYLYDFNVSSNFFLFNYATITLIACIPLSPRVMSKVTF